MLFTATVIDFNVVADNILLMLVHFFLNILIEIMVTYLELHI